MSPKTILCRCLDVTEEDVRRAVAEGFTSPEDVKRATGALMGPCQGKMCARNFMEVLARATGTPARATRPPVRRPPAEALPLGWLAADDPEADAP